MIFLFCFSLFLSLRFHIQYVFANNKSLARLPNCWKLRDTKRKWKEERLSAHWNMQAPKFLSMQRFKLHGIHQVKQLAGQNIVLINTWVLPNFSEWTASPLPLLSCACTQCEVQWGFCITVNWAPVFVLFSSFSVYVGFVTAMVVLKKWFVVRSRGIT